MPQGRVVLLVGLVLLSLDGVDAGRIEDEVRAARRVDAHRAHAEQALEQREFMPVLQRLIGVSSFGTPSTWDVQTDRGAARFVLKGEEDIRRLSQIRLLIADANGIQFLVRDLSTLDKQSRKLLDRFL